MRCKSLLSFALLALSTPALAQDPSQPFAPPPPPAGETPPASPPAPPPPPPRQVYDGEQPQPPAPYPAPVRRPMPPQAPEPPAQIGFGLEASTAGFASGTLQGGLLMGVAFPGGSIAGFRLDYKDQTQTSGSTSVSQTAYGLGVGGRIAVAGDRNGVDLALGFDALIVKADGGSDMGPPSTEVSGYGFGFGPQLRYWIHHRLAIGYLVQVNYTKLTSERSSSLSSGEASISNTGIDGRFTLSGGF